MPVDIVVVQVAAGRMADTGRKESVQAGATAPLR